MSREFKIKKVFFLGLSLFCIFIFCGCVKRVVTIDSDPPGAKVYFDKENKERGTTPCTFDFTFYGKYYVKLVKEGYEDLNSTIYLKAPIYEYFPIDLFSEVVWPRRLSDQHYQSYKLTAVEEELE